MDGRSLAHYVEEAQSRRSAAERGVLQLGERVAERGMVPDVDSGRRRA